MKKLPLVSVIIPMYNAEMFIADTLESLVHQEYSNMEVVIVDNASTDSSVEIVERYGNLLTLKLIKCANNSGGPAKPRNIGINNSIGEYIAFLDADDLWEPNKLSHQINVMARYKYNFTCTSLLPIDEKSQKISRIRDFSFSKRDKVYGLRSMLFRNSIVTSSVIVNRELLGQHEFDESKSIVTCEDYLLWLNLINKESCSFLHITKKLVSYRVVGSSLGNATGMHMFAAKSLLASSDFLVKNKKQNLMYITLISNILRISLLFLLRRK